jgi:hypothetical protein
MTEAKKEPVVHTDPLNGDKIRVQSVYRPTKSLLEGMKYRNSNEQLGQKQGVLK